MNISIWANAVDLVLGLVVGLFVSLAVGGVLEHNKVRDRSLWLLLFQASALVVCCFVWWALLHLRII